MQKHNIKPGTPSAVPSKVIIINWLKSLFSLDISPSTKIQDFGDGVIYCRLLNHYYGNPIHSKITWSPKNQYQYSNNLRHAQGALLQLGIPITFDVNRVSKRKFLENWVLINSFYRHFNNNQQLQSQKVQENSLNFLNTATQLVQAPQINYAAPNSFHSSAQISSTPRYGQTSLVKVSSINSNQSEPRVPLKHLNAGNLTGMQNIQRTHIEFGSLARNSLHLSQYLKQNASHQTSSPPKGKWSVGSQMFQNNHNAVVDRVKQILLKDSHDTQKIRQIKMLLGMPVDQEQVIKIEDDLVQGPIMYNQGGQKTKSQQTSKFEQTQKKYIKEQQSIGNQKQHISVTQTKNSACKITKKPFKV